MNFTFGIITNATKELNPLLLKSIESIEKLKIPECEIIVVGGGGKNLNPIRNRVKVIDFDESKKPAWITKKKNIITNQAKHINVVYAHDYISFDENWYEGFKTFGGDWHLAMTKMINTDGERYRDWTVFPHRGLMEAARKFSGFQGHECLLPFDEKGFSKLQYFSGAYWVAKKHVMKEFPLNESLAWGEGEDVIWSENVREKYKFSMNVHSSVHLLKWKSRAFYEMRHETYIKMKQFLQMHKKYG